jgi:hypothetical protein
VSARALPRPGRGRTRREPVTDFDSPWKEILDLFFGAFLAFFFPQAHADIDWAHGYETLDKELQQVVGSAEQGRRYVDKLVKVWRKNGEERWLLVHVEVQVWREGGIPKRMFVYNYRIFDRYDKEVINLAVLADDDPAWRPSRYGYGRWGFRMDIEFPTVKLLDYAPHGEALEAHPNPFATVVLAHLKTLETRKVPADRQAWKVRLVKGLFERGLSAEEVRQLFRFIDWIMDLPKPLDNLFWQEITQYQQENQMPFMTTPERLIREESLLKGIAMCLKLKFGAPGLELLPELRLQNLEKLEAVLEAIETAASPADLRRVWAP